MFIMFCVRSAGPMLKFQFSWMGTLMRLAIGFCAAFLSASALSAVGAGLAAGSGGLSCANADTAASKKEHGVGRFLSRRVKRFIGLFLAACVDCARQRWTVVVGLFAG